MKKKTIGKEYIFTALILFVVLAVTMVLDSQLPSYHIVIKVIKKASVYSLVAVSMNLLNGFTGLFSLGQAGFMLLGAYSYAVLCIPVAKRAGVYQYFDGGIVKFSLPEIFASFLGDKVGSAVGMILAPMSCAVSKSLAAARIPMPILVFLMSATSAKTSAMVRTGVTTVTRLVDVPKSVMVSEIQGIDVLTGCGRPPVR